MEKTAKKTAASGAKNLEKLLKNYKEYVLINGERPASVFTFTNDLKLNEQQFYEYFGSFNALERYIWKGYVSNTIEVIEQEEVYNEYSVREKLLSFYYSLIEVLKADRSFVQYTFSNIKRTALTPPFLVDFKQRYKEYVQSLVAEGFEREEIVKRPVIGNKYDDGLWLQVMFIIDFWLKDDSAMFENTDAAIEKSVNLSFELMGKGTLDMMIDFAKFLYHNK